MYILLRFYPSSFFSLLCVFSRPFATNTKKEFINNNINPLALFCIFTFFSVLSLLQQPKNVSTTPNFYFMIFLLSVCVFVCAHLFSSILSFFSSSSMHSNVPRVVDRKYRFWLLQFMCICLHVYALAY